MEQIIASDRHNTASLCGVSPLAAEVGVVAEVEAGGGSGAALHRVHQAALVQALPGLLLVAGAAHRAPRPAATQGY